MNFENPFWKWYRKVKIKDRNSSRSFSLYPWWVFNSLFLFIWNPNLFSVISVFQLPVILHYYWQFQIRWLVILHYCQLLKASMQMRYPIPKVKEQCSPLLFVHLINPFFHSWDFGWKHKQQIKIAGKFAEYLAVKK